MRNATEFPPFPELKSFQICFTGDTIKDGERSSENGLNPLKLLPARLSNTKSAMTSSTRTVSKTVSMVDFEIIYMKKATDLRIAKFMKNIGLAIEFGLKFCWMQVRVLNLKLRFRLTEWLALMEAASFFWVCERAAVRKPRKRYSGQRDSSSQ